MCIYITSIVAWVKNPFRRTTEHNYRNDYLLEVIIEVIRVNQRHEADASVPVYTLCCSTSIERYSIPTDYGTTIKSLHTRAITTSKFLLLWHYHQVSTY